MILKGKNAKVNNDIIINYQINNCLALFIFTKHEKIKNYLNVKPTHKLGLWSIQSAKRREPNQTSECLKHKL